MKPILKKIMAGESLARPLAIEAMEQILEGGIKVEQVAGFLVALHSRGETFEELSGFLAVLRQKMIPFPASHPLLFDCCGTGGDDSGTFNISTTVAFLLAGAGIPVAKHGNRAVSSRSGSADVLEKLNLEVAPSPEQSGEALARCGLSFLFAPLYHPVLARLAPMRRALQVRTVFNLLGPLLNPAPVKRQLVGVYEARWLVSFVKLLRENGVERALAVCSEDGLDEISISAPTHAAEIRDGQVREFTVSPEDFGLPRAPKESIRGGTPEENARLIERILGGEETGPPRNVVLLNAAAALVTAGQAESFPEGVERAKAAIETGRARGVLESLRQLKGGGR